MTDIPELQHLLIDASTRRSRRRRRRAAGTRFAALSAAALVAVVLYPRGESADVEVPAAVADGERERDPRAAHRRRGLRRLPAPRRGRRRDEARCPARLRGR